MSREATTLVKLASGGQLAFGDGYRTRKDQLGGCIPILRVAQVQDGRPTVASGDMIREDFRGSIGRKLSKPGDVLVTTKGTVGRVAIVPDGFPEHAYSPQLCFLRVLDAQAIDARWLYYWAASENFSRQAQAVMGQTDMAPYISLRDLARFQLDLPPLEEQRRIAGVLGALDDLASTNQAIVQRMGAMAEAAFDRLIKHANDSDTRRVPFSDSVVIWSGGTPKTSVDTYWGGHIPWFSVVDSPSDGESWVRGTEKSITAEGLANSSAQLLPVSTTILSARGTVGKVALTSRPMAMNQSCYGLTSATGHAGYFTFFSTKRLVSELQQRAHGSVFSTITRATLASVTTPLPADDVITEFELKIEPLMSGMLALLDESEKARRTRDELLPLLLSGRVRVGEVTA